MILKLIFIALLLVFNANSQPLCEVLQSQGRLVLQNSFVHMEMNLKTPEIDVLIGQFQGTPNFNFKQEENVMANGQDPLSLNRKGLVLERDSIDSSGNFQTVASSMGIYGNPPTVTIITNNSNECSVRVSGIYDSNVSPIFTSEWFFSINTESRYVGINIQLQPIQGADLSGIIAVRISLYTSPLSAFAFFERGIVQMMTQLQRSALFSNNPLNRFYVMGGGALDISQGNNWQTQVAILSGTAQDSFFQTGIQFILVGNYPTIDQWISPDWSQVAPSSINPNANFTISFNLWPNNFDFPTSSIPKFTDAMNFNDLRTLYTSIYGSSVGILVGYYNTSLSEDGVTLSHPFQSYTGLYNFYDPDTFFTIATLMLSYDPYLWNEARKLIEKSESAMLPTGQLPHHFIGETPTYVAISGATQTGPNSFWILAALRYVQYSGDYVWLKNHLQNLELALEFLLNMYDPNMQLVNSPGPLWIDVFIRNNYTSDTNSLFVYLLKSMADAENSMSQENLAQQHLLIAGNIAAAMNKYLWSSEDDHFVTQMNPDGTIRDFVDYDSNLLAVAFGVPFPDRALKILKRVDSGNCTHARATWVSERYYDAKNCYNGNTGDSGTFKRINKLTKATAMARIGWADGMARYATNDLETYTQIIMQPIMNDLFKYTWLTERYNCQGQTIRSPYYHEYPEMLSVLLHDVSYGIQIGFSNVIINPFVYSEYNFYMGQMTVLFSNTTVLIQNLPGNGCKQFTISKLIPNKIYGLENSNSTVGVVSSITTNSNGVAVFQAQTGMNWSIYLNLSVF